MRHFITIFLIILSFTACSTKKLNPSNVSDYFWSAQKVKNYQDAKKFVRSSDGDDVKLQHAIKIKRYTLGSAKIKSKTLAYVPTTLYLEGFFKNDPGSELRVDFDTVLNRTDDGWKVNMKETRRALYIKAMQAFGRGLGRGLAEKLKGSLQEADEFKNIFKDILKNMADSVKGLKR
jgi:hypothetical protein